jgi:hypothetical protein
MLASPPDRNAPDTAVREHDATLTYDGSEPSRIRVRALHRDGPARASRAVRTWAACWGLAVAAVFLPVLHFILVPLLLLAGPALAWGRLHEAASLVSAEGACPACGASQRFTLGDTWRERTALRCEACGRRIELVLPASPP